MASCLRTKNATDMVNEEWNGIAFGIMNCPFVPVLDGDFFPGNFFLKQGPFFDFLCYIDVCAESPANALRRGNFKKTRLLLGTNRNEGYYFLIYYLVMYKPFGIPCGHFPEIAFV